MFVFWSAKGGSGTTVVASSLALVLARTRPVTLVDLAGDVPAALGMHEPPGPGVLDWLASPTATPGALANLATPATEWLRIVPRGTPRAVAEPAARWAALGAALADIGRAGGSTVVVDAGHDLARCGSLVGLFDAAEHRLLVTTTCFLSIRRASALTARPTGIVLVKQAGRALSARDLEHAFGAPVVAEVPWDPAVFRAVDAGMLAGRLPATASRALSRLVHLTASSGNPA